MTLLLLLLLLPPSTLLLAVVVAVACTSMVRYGKLRNCVPELVMLAKWTDEFNETADTFRDGLFMPPPPGRRLVVLECADPNSADDDDAVTS